MADLSDVVAWKRGRPPFLEEAYVEDHLQEAASAVLTKRRGLLQAQGRRRTAPPSAAAGRWLVLKTDEHLKDGSAYFASGELLDGRNFPPCDWWVEFRTEGAKPLLVSWVPCVDWAAIQSGIDVNPEECLGWAELA